MAFMKPHYTNQPFHRGETRNGETVLMPAEVYGTLARFVREESIVHGTAEEIDGKWFARLSAPGYMDCTDWSGPYPTLDAARKAIADMWDVDPDTGDDDSGEEG